MKDIYTTYIYVGFDIGDPGLIISIQDRPKSNVKAKQINIWANILCSK